MHGGNIFKFRIQNGVLKVGRALELVIQQERKLNTKIQLMGEAKLVFLSFFKLLKSYISYKKFKTLEA